MSGYCITFRSITYAQRGERVLQMAGVNSTLRRTPRWMEERGCGYCLQVGKNVLHRAVEVLREGDVPYRKVYNLAPGREAQEVRV